MILASCRPVQLYFWSIAVVFAGYPSWRPNEFKLSYKFTRNWTWVTWLWAVAAVSWIYQIANSIIQELVIIPCLWGWFFKHKERITVYSKNANYNSNFSEAFHVCWTISNVHTLFLFAGCGCCMGQTLLSLCPTDTSSIIPSYGNTAFMATLCNSAGRYIFVLWFLLLSFTFFFFFFLSFFLAYTQPSPIGCLQYFHTWYGLGANLGCRSEMCWKIQDAKNGPKFAMWGLSHNFCRAASSQLRHVSSIGKKLVKQQYLLHISSQYGELRPTNSWDRFTSLGEWVVS